MTRSAQQVPLCFGFLGVLLLPPCIGAPGHCEVLWDDWGVPHIYAADRASLFYCFGWAQASSHGEAVLRRFARARCRSAEYIGGGDSAAAEDEFHLRTGLRETGRFWYHGAPRSDREQLDAFAAGFGKYVQANRERFSPAALRVVDAAPISGEDAATTILLSWFYFSTLNLRSRLAAALGSVPAARQKGGGTEGSNAFAAKRAGGGSLLHINPHLAWDSDILFEVHLVVKSEGLDWYGAALIGDASPSVGFGQEAGWSHTVNYVEPYTLYEHTLRSAPGSPGGWEYLWDGEWQAFSKTTYDMHVRGAPQKRVSVLRSAAGPVLAIDASAAKAISFRWAADVFAQQGRTPALLSQTWDQMRVNSVDELKAVISRQQVPCFHYVASDSAGTLLFVSNSWTPDYGRGDWALWSGAPVPSNRSADLWQSVVRFSEQPQVMTPEAGFVSNANDAPWQASLPLFTPQPASSPPWYAPPPWSAPFQARFRPKACLRAVRQAVRAGAGGATLQSMLAASMDTSSESSRHLLDSLLEAAGGSSNELVLRARRVLQAWDRHYLPSSSGAVLWGRWLEHAQALSKDSTGLLARYTIPPDFMATAWQEADPLDTPARLANPPLALHLLQQAVTEMDLDGVRLDATWGESCKLPPGADGKAWPGVGSTDDSVRDLWVHLRPPPGRNFSTAYGGGTFKAVVEFLPNGSRRAFVQLAYGDATMRGSRHHGDQWRLFSEGRYREARLSLADVEAHVSRWERLAVGGGLVEAAAEWPQRLPWLLSLVPGLLLLVIGVGVAMGLLRRPRWRRREAEGYVLVE